MEEYRKANFMDMLWWRPFHYDEFMKSALEEIKVILRAKKAYDVKSAMAVMYREDYECSAAGAAA